MIFNTGAALLDAIVLAVVSKEKEGTYGLLARHLIEYLPQAMRKGEES